MGPVVLPLTVGSHFLLRESILVSRVGSSSLALICSHESFVFCDLLKNKKVTVPRLLDWKAGLAPTVYQKGRAGFLFSPPCTSQDGQFGWK